MVGAVVQGPGVGHQQEGQAGAAVLVLVGDAERMALGAQGEHAAEKAIVHIGMALGIAAEVADVGLEIEAAGQRYFVQQAGGVLAVVILEFGAVQRGAQAGGEGVGCTGIVETVGCHATPGAV
ncbi:hypothetical protein D3C76_1010340 [compost metagenome]